MTADSLPKHRLRILSGHHAGAEVLLLARNSLSASRDSDLQLLDWVGEELHIIRPNAETVWWSELADTHIAQSPKIWDNWSPLRFGGVLLAHGPDGRWPSDEELWSRWLASRGAQPIHPQPRWRRAGLTRYMAWAGGVALCATIWLGTRYEGKVDQAKPENLASAVERLSSDRINLKLSQSSPARLTGWVLDANDRNEVLQLLSRHATIPVVQEFHIASEVQKALGTAMGPHVLIQRIDGQRFVVTGSVSDLPKARRLLANTLNDLRLPHGQVLDRLTSSPELIRPLERASLKTDALRYQQQADGSLWIQLGPWQQTGKDAAQRTDTP